MKPRDLAGAAHPVRPSPSPRRHQRRLFVSRINFDDDRYDQAIWLWDGEHGPGLFTHGSGDSSPRGRPTELDWLSCARARVTKTNLKSPSWRLGVVRLTVVSDFPLGVEALEWSPPGDQLVVVGVDWVEEWAGLDDDERKRRPRRIDRVPFRFDNRGWLHDRRRHLYLVDPSARRRPAV